MSAVLYAKGHKGIEFTGFLTNISDPENPIPVNLVNEMTPYIIFTKPDGTKIEKQAELVDLNANLADGADIVWHDDQPDEPSLLDQVGHWEYTVAVRFTNGTFVKSPYGESFWVT